MLYTLMYAKVNRKLPFEGQNLSLSL